MQKLFITIHKKDKNELVKNTLKSMLKVNKKLKNMKGGSNNTNITIKGNIDNLNSIQRNMINNIMTNNKMSGGSIDKTQVFKNITKNIVNAYLTNPSNYININNHKTRIYIIASVVIIFIIILFISIIYLICYCFSI